VHDWGEGGNDITSRYDYGSKKVVKQCSAHSSNLSNAVQQMSDGLPTSRLHLFHRFQFDEHRVDLRHDAADRVFHAVNSALQHRELLVRDAATSAIISTATPSPRATMNLRLCGRRVVFLVAQVQAVGVFLLGKLQSIIFDNIICNTCKPENE